MKGRHSSPDAPRQALASRQVALAVAPVAAIAFAVGCGAAGVITGRPTLAAVGAGAGAGAVVLEQLANRAARRRQRSERIELRNQIRDLDGLVASLKRQLESRPAVLASTPPPLRLAEIRQTASTGPLPVVAYDHASAPATPRSLPILTANHRGLQSSVTEEKRQEVVEPAVEVGAIGLPAQRPPATPIDGLLLLPNAINAELPRLAPGPSLPLPTQSAVDTGSIPILVPGPSRSLLPEGTDSTPSPGDGAGQWVRGRELEPALVGGPPPLPAQSLAVQPAGRHQPRSATSAPVATESAVDAAFRAAVLRAADVLGARGQLPPALEEVRGAALGEPKPVEVVDLRMIPVDTPMTKIASMDEVEEQVYAEISARPQDELLVPTGDVAPRRRIALFAPMEVPVSVDSDMLQRNVSGARSAAQGLRRQELTPPPLTRVSVAENRMEQSA